MNSAYYFLLIPVVVILVASAYLYVRGRKPTGLRAGVDGFQREMEALSPGARPKPRRFESERTPPGAGEGG